MSMLSAIAVIIVQRQATGRKNDHSECTEHAQGDIGVSDPRAFCPGAAECLLGCPRTGVVSSRADRLNRRLLGLLVFSAVPGLPGPFDSPQLILVLLRLSPADGLKGFVARRSSRWARAISSRSCCRSVFHSVAEVASAVAAAVSCNCRSLRTASFPGSRLEGRQLGVEVGNGCLGLLQGLPEVVIRGSLIVE